MTLVKIWTSLAGLWPLRDCKVLVNCLDLLLVFAQHSPVPEMHNQAVHCVSEPVLAPDKHSWPTVPFGPKLEPVSAQHSKSLRALPTKSLAALEGSERHENCGEANF